MQANQLMKIGRLVKNAVLWLMPGLLVMLALACALFVLLSTITGMSGQSAHAQLQGEAQSGYYQTGVQQAGGPENILIILDASDSMSEYLKSGETKMAAAKRVILETLHKIPPNVPVGLRVYGHRSVNSCRSSDLLVPIMPNNRYQIASTITRVKPTGATPISYALTQALASDFMNRPGRKSIILVSDGIETCGMDPCDVAVKMMQSGADVKINVVGYGLRDLDGIRQLKCVALATKAKFYNVDTAAQLANSLDNLFGARKEVQAQILIPGAQSPGAPAQTQMGQPGMSQPAPAYRGPVYPQNVQPQLSYPAPR